MANLRERGKARRVQRILDAAAHIMETDGIDALSMQALADEAEVSISTLYNLVGGKDAILLLLLSVMVDDLEMAAPEPDTDPLTTLGVLVDNFVAPFGERESLYRPLFLTLDRHPVMGQAADEIRRRIMTIVGGSVAEAIDMGMLDDSIPPVVIAHQVCLTAETGLRRWSMGMTDLWEFLAEIKYGLWLALLAVATPPTRTRILGELAALEPTITELATQGPVAHVAVKT